MSDTLETLDLADLVPDPHNARVHTPRTLGTIVDLMHAVGAGRGIVIDEHDVVLAGNATREAALEAGFRKVLVIDQDKDALTVVRRTGLTPRQKVTLALGDNRAGEFSSYDPAVLVEMKDAGVDMSGLFTTAQWETALNAGKETPEERDQRATAGSGRRAQDAADPELRYEQYIIPLAPDQEAVLEQLVQDWLAVYGSDIGAGQPIVEAICAVVETPA